LVSCCVVTSISNVGIEGKRSDLGFEISENKPLVKGRELIDL